MRDLKELLPEDIADALIEAEYDTPEKVLAASRTELLAVAGIRRTAIPSIIEAVRDPLDVALDPFKPVAKEFAKAWKNDYPDSSTLVEINSKIITVGDFRRLFKALKNKEQ
jgi:hypothetical protein